MAASKISALTETTTLNVADLLALVDVSDTAQAASGSTRKATLDTLATWLQQTHGMSRVLRLGSQHSLSSATATKVTGLDMTLENGTYVFRYAILCRTATAADGPQFGVNFSGTATVAMHFRFADATTAISAEVHSMDNVGIKTAGFISGMAHNAFSTTSPNMGTTIGTAATGTNILAWIEGVLVVTGSGDLQLYHGCEGTNASSVEVDSSLIVNRTA